MSISIYYSWQMELPSVNNRRFIQSALTHAAEKVDGNVLITSARRSNDGPDISAGENFLEGPSIVDERMCEISKCGIFVGDLTFVGKSITGRSLPDPNVLLDFGWALNSITEARIIPIMNTAFGEPNKENMAFILRFFPQLLTYELKHNVEEQAYYEVRNELVDNLVNEINQVLKNGSLNSGYQMRPETQPKIKSTSNPSTFLKPGELFAKVQDSPWTEKSLTLPENARIFLRLIPCHPYKAIINREKIMQLVRNGNLVPMGEGEIDSTIGHNDYGGFSCRYVDEKVLNFSQLFYNGEIWGVDAEVLVKDQHSEKNLSGRGLLPAVLFERTFNVTLIDYIRFASETLKLTLPLRFIAGITDVQGYKLGAPPGMQIGYESSGGEILDTYVCYEGIIEDYKVQVNQVLRPFFDQIWDACGLYRPDEDYLG